MKPLVLAYALRRLALRVEGSGLRAKGSGLRAQGPEEVRVEG